MLFAVCVRLKLVQLDVTDEKQISEAYDFIESCVGTEGQYLQLYRVLDGSNIFIECLLLTRM